MYDNGLSGNVFNIEYCIVLLNYGFVYDNRLSGNVFGKLYK